MATEIKHTLHALLIDNTVTADNKDDKILQILLADTVDLDGLVARMMKVNPGLEEETIRMVLDLRNRCFTDTLLEGHRVNDGLVIAEPRAQGIIEGGTWNPERNTLYVNFHQGKALRQAIAATAVNIVEKKGDTMYIIDGENPATRSEGFVATAGRAFTLKGSKLKVVGDAEGVGIKLTDSDGTETIIPQDMWIINTPSKLTFLLPSDLEDGEYVVSVTTQYSVGHLLKEPRTATQTITIGEMTTDGGSGTVTPPGGDGSEEEGGVTEDPLG